MIVISILWSHIHYGTAIKGGSNGVYGTGTIRQ